MKKHTIRFAFLYFLIAIIIINAYTIDVEIDGKKIKFDVEPQIIEGRTMVPLRGIFEALGVELDWEGATQTINAHGPDGQLSMKVGDKFALINGKKVILDVPAMLVNNRTMVPTRFIAESVGAKVDWDGIRNTVVIAKEIKNNAILKPLPVVEQFKPNGIRGNSVGNIANYSYVAGDGQYIYYSDQKFLYKINNKSGEKNKIFEGYIDGINIIGNWIYFNNRGIQRLNTDGKNLEQLTTDSSVCITVIDNWIYYSNWSKNGIYSVSIDGTGNKKIIGDKALYLNVVGDYIYYQNIDDGEKIYKIRTDGTERQKLNDDISFHINVVNDWIYYTNRSDDWKIYKMKTDGSERKILSNDRSIFLNIHENWIYYANTFDHHKMYRTSLDGIQREKISDDSVRHINIIGNMVYYKDLWDETKKYRISLDGKTKEQLN